MHRYYKLAGQCMQCADGAGGKIYNLLLYAALVVLWILVNHFLCESLESVDVRTHTLARTLTSGQLARIHASTCAHARAHTHACARALSHTQHTLTLHMHAHTTHTYTHNTRSHTPTQRLAHRAHAHTRTHRARTHTPRTRTHRAHARMHARTGLSGVRPDEQRDRKFRHPMASGCESAYFQNI